jgi:arylsulfatase
MYSTDNGPHMNTWPDAAMTPFRNEKNSNWEGALRVPLLVRWPGKIPAGVAVNDIVQHHDWLPTFLAAAGEPDINEKLTSGDEKSRWPRAQTWRRLREGGRQVPSGDGRVA